MEGFEVARARNIKPGFFKNYDLADQGPIAQLLFAGLWCLADKEGRLEDRPRLIKAEIFPYYECDVNGELTKLSRLGFVRRYSCGGMAVIEIINFKEHQSPHHTEKDSVLPAFCATGSISCCLLDAPEISSQLPLVNASGTVEIPLIPDSLIPDSLIQEHAALAPPISAPKADASKKNKSKKHTASFPLPDNFCISEGVRRWYLGKSYAPNLLNDHLESFISYAKRSGKQYADWDQALMGAIREDWGGVREKAGRAKQSKSAEVVYT